MNPIKSLKNLSLFEWGLWIFSLIVVFASGALTPNQSPLMLINSLIGVTALIFVAKADVLGQLLTVVFSLLYAVISFSFSYYGEMITYLGMTMPIALMSVISWLRHPFSKDGVEVKVNKIAKNEWLLMLFAATAVTVAFYFILRLFNTSNLIFSTISITTSFAASYLSFRRSPFYALAYSANDVVLIILWVLASLENSVYVPVVVCFSMFFINDVYGFINWNRIKKRQNLLSMEEF